MTASAKNAPKRNPPRSAAGRGRGRMENVAALSLRALGLTSLVCLAALCAAAVEAPAPVNSVDELQAWRAAREARLRSETGWLTVSGLFWLGPGSNGFGSGQHNPIRLPSSVPAQAGTIEFADGQARYRLAAGVSATLDDKPAPAEGLLKPDTSGSPNVLALGPVSFFVIERGGRFGVRVKDKDSAARRDFKGLEWYPPDAAYRVSARFVAYDAPRELKVVNVLGQVESMKSPGYAEFSLRGRRLRLEPVLEEPDAEEYFFIFRDLTSGHGTYAAGRFLYAPRPQDGTLLLDFNKAYSPPCAFTRYATCPLPPEPNRLDVAIEAGERFQGAHSN